MPAPAKGLISQVIESIDRTEPQPEARPKID